MHTDENYNYNKTHNPHSRVHLKGEFGSRDEMQEGQSIESRTSIQISPATRDRLYKLKFRRTYDQFLNELCEAYEKAEKTKEKMGQ